MIFAKFEISNDYGKLLEQATTMPNFWKKISNTYRDFKIADYLIFYFGVYNATEQKGEVTSLKYFRRKSYLRHLTK